MLNFENLHGLADTTEDLHELKVSMMQWLSKDESTSDENDSEDNCPDLQMVSASSESESSDNGSSAWPYCDENESPFRNEDKESSEWETVVSGSADTSDSSQIEYHTCAGCHSMEFCETESYEGSEMVPTHIPYQVLFNSVWDLLDMEALDTKSEVDEDGVQKMLLDSVICYLIEMDAGENSPPDSP